jgi:glycosyltransferase involved in cell wall biosynthesis
MTSKVQPKILVIMPVYNKEKFLKNAIDSVFNQTYKNLHLVIVDDASTDSSVDIAKQYLDRDNFTFLQNKENKGCYYTRNHALYHFKHDDWDYFTIHDSDDTSLPERLETMMRSFSNPNLLGLKSRYIRVNEKYEQEYLEGTKIPNIYDCEGQAIFSRKAFEIFGFFDKTNFSGDTDYWWRLEAFCSQNPPYICGAHPKAMYYAINHDHNLTKVYDFKTVRPQYFQKSRMEIETKMKPINDFYRSFSM